MAHAGGSGDADCNSIMKKFGLQPITRCSLAKFYVPAFGTASYTAMSMNVMNPSLVVKWVDNPYIPTIIRPYNTRKLITDESIDEM